MENHDKRLHHPSPSRVLARSATSGVDGQAVFPAPPSPSLDTFASGSGLSRRRSWGNRLREGNRTENSSPDSTNLNTPTSPRRSATVTNDRALTMSHTVSDPLLHPDSQSYFDPTHEYMQRTASNTSSGDGSYPTSLAGPSTVSLIGGHRGHFEHEVDDGHREDDEAHLTANMSHSGMGDNSPEGYSSGDPEHEGSSTPRSRRRTVRYSASPSPLKKTETAMKTVSKSLRRMSLRVVNLANTGLEGQLRLGDGDEGKLKIKTGAEDDEEGPPVPDLKKVLPIRGRTLGFLGPTSKIRLTLFNFLVHP
ncbi:hypothetical protein D9613_009466 [Agrocybe pediades]|uniref:Uncharacterized protein n=1 Tax=Agrocybe pediades TaxID=84607 RepID=A0A8H4VTZ8_9AGAR|nr:hypothetical protein D9613_009466 [Agrocybe pediades]